MNKLARLLAATTLASATYLPSVQAAQCSVNFNYGVVIGPDHVRVVDGSQTYVQFNGDNQVFVRGREVILAEEDKTIVAEFVNGIRLQVPQIVNIAIEGVEIGLKTVNNVIASLTGENSATHRKIQEKFDEMQWRMRRRFNLTDQHYYIAPQDFNEFDQIVAGQFEDELEEIVSESIGTILSAIGEAMASRDEENIEQRARTFDQPIESMSGALDLEFSNEASILEQKAEQFCLNLTALDKVENEMQLRIEQLADFNLISTNKHEK